MGSDGESDVTSDKELPSDAVICQLPPSESKEMMDYIQDIHIPHMMLPERNLQLLLTTLQVILLLRQRMFS